MRLASFVHVHREDGPSVVFGPDDVVPDWAVEKITNPGAWATPPAPEPELGDFTADEQVPDASAPDVLAWVDGDLGRAQAAHDVEVNRDPPRKGLLADLDKLLQQ